MGMNKTNWVFLVGNNGFGTTLVLRGLYLAINGISDATSDTKNFVSDDEKLAIYSIIATTQNGVENTIKASYDAPTAENKLFCAAYGPTRLDFASDNLPDEVLKNKNAAHSLFRSSGFLFNIERQLRDWHNEEPQKYDAVCAVLVELMPNITKVSFNKASKRIEYIETETDENGEKTELPALEFSQLATSYKSIITMVGDMIIRLWASQPDAATPHDLQGIVLIDEIDVHLHPIWQKKLPRLFSSVFPQVQFIVSTHSPIPLLGAPRGAAIIKVNRTKETGITTEYIDIDVTELTPNTILSSPIFGFGDFISTEFDPKTQRLRTADRFEKVLYDEFLQKKADALAGTTREQDLLAYFQSQQNQ